MALIIPGKTTCPLCEKVIQQDHEIVATSHFIGDRQDPLWQFSDAAFHKSCFLAWEQREVFISRFNEIVGTHVFGNGTSHYMEADGTVISRDAKR